ncbi:MAG: M23 family metallopeptidase [Mangrovibacterium sp.]
MAKFKFNRETLSFEQDKQDVKGKVRSSILMIFATLVIAIVISVVFLQYYESPRMIRQKAKNEKLMAQYEILTKNMDDIERVLGDIQQRDDNLYRVVFEADPIPASIRMAGFGGINRYEKLENLDESGLVKEATRKLEILTKKAYVQSKSYEELAKLARNKEEMLASIPAIMPVADKKLKYMASGYGYRIDPLYKVRKFHAGMDFAAPVGTPVYATGNGVVEDVQRLRGGYGNNIKINHGYSYETRYAHLHEIKVKEGETVVRGQLIGLVGSSGKSTGPHLHYEVRKDGVAMNPQHYYFKDLTPEEFDKMVAISDNAGQSLD